MRMQWQLWSCALSEEQVNAIIGIGESYPPVEGTIFRGDVENKIRSSTVRWINDLSVRDLLWEYVKESNVRAFGFDIQNFAELQFTEYHASEGGHYDWHYDVDWQGDTPSDRKVSITVQLSDPSEYEGGDFEFNDCETPSDAKKKGTVLVFPSYLQHRVTPLTSGTRKSLVAWFHGPRWR
jgi:PKHD-type hydroxylase